MAAAQSRDDVRRIHGEATIALTHNHMMFREEFERMRAGGVTLAFAVVAMDGRMHAPTSRWLDSLKNDEGLLRDALVAIDYLEWLCAQPGSPVLIAREPSDVSRAKKEQKVALMLGCEGSRFLERRLSTLRTVARLGMRYVAPMWFYDCAVGTAQESDEGPAGLTPWGRELIAESNRLGLIIDITHFSEPSIVECCAISKTPVLVSHTGARALNPEAKQLLTDRAIKAVGASGGVLGMMFQSFIIKPGYDKAPLEALLRQFEYCASLVGPEHVAVGPDYQYLDPRVSGGNNPTGRSPGPFTYPDGVEDPSTLMVLTEALLGRGFSEKEVKLILGGNVMRLFEQARANAAPGPQGDYSHVGEHGRHGIGTVTEGLTPV